MGEGWGCFVGVRGWEKRLVLWGGVGWGFVGGVDVEEGGLDIDGGDSVVFVHGHLHRGCEGIDDFHDHYRYVGLADLHGHHCHGSLGDGAAVVLNLDRHGYEGIDGLHDYYSHEDLGGHNSRPFWHGNLGVLHVVVVLRLDGHDRANLDVVFSLDIDLSLVLLVDEHALASLRGNRGSEGRALVLLDI